MFHIHPDDPREDFLLLSPLDPDRELVVYEGDKRDRGGRKYHFCPRCGVRCFMLEGEGEREIVNLTGLDKYDNIEEGKRAVWHAKKWDDARGEQKEETRPDVSVNGRTIDFNAEFDLRFLLKSRDCGILVKGVRLKRKRRRRRDGIDHIVVEEVVDWVRWVVGGLMPARRRRAQLAKAGGPLARARATHYQGDLRGLGYAQC